MKNILFVVINIILLSISLKAQDLDLSFSGSLTWHFDATTDIDITIPNSGFSPPGPISWFLYNDDPFDGIPDGFNSIVGSHNFPGTSISINFSPDGSGDTNATITGSAPNVDLPPIRFRIRAENSLGTGHDRVYNIIIRQPRDIVFVLDKSGSMNSRARLGDVASPRRWELVQSGLEYFLSNLGIIDGACDPDNSFSSLASDRYSVVFFNNAERQAIEAAHIHLNSLGNLCDFWGNTISPDHIFDEFSPGGATSIGAGLVGAINNRIVAGYDDNSRKIIVLFTDGEQNSGYWVDIDAGVNISILDSFGGVDALCNPPTGLGPHPPCTDLFNSYESIFLSVWNTPSANSLYDMLASNSFLEVTDNGTPLSTDIISGMGEVYEDIFENFSPQLIKRDKRALKQKDSTTYTCNKNITKLNFSAIFQKPIAASYDYIIKKDGVNVTDSFYNHQSEFFANLSCVFQNRKGFNSEGEWTFIYKATDDDVLNTENGIVTLSAVADDHNIRFESSYGPDHPNVGGLLRPSIKLLNKGKPVENATIVKATIFKPGADINHLLALHPDTATTQLDAKTCATKKLLNKLKYDPTFKDTYMNKIAQTINLTYQGDGVYAGQYNDLDVSGTYKVLYEIKAETSLGTVERSEWQTVTVRFGDIKRLLSISESKKIRKVTVGHVRRGYLTGDAYISPNVIDVSITASNKTIQWFSFRPTYLSKGQPMYIGPGYDYGISLTDKNNKPIPATVFDKCDGTYDIVLHDRISGRKKVNLSVLGDKVYSGRADRFNEVSKGKFGTSGGITIPFKELDSLYNQGYFTELGLGYRFGKNWGIDLIGGYYNFANDFNILGGTGYLNIYFSNSPNGWSFYGGIGGGYYKPQSLEASLGYSFKGVLEKQINRNMSTFIKGSYFNIKDYEGYSFGAADIGVRFHF